MLVLSNVPIGESCMFIPMNASGLGHEAQHIIVQDQMTLAVHGELYFAQVPKSCSTAKLSQNNAG